MPNGQDPGSDAVAAREGAPPTNSTPAPARSSSPRSIIELPADVPETAAPVRGLPDQQGPQERDASRERPARKPEGSGYASSYRASGQLAEAPPV